MSRRTGWAAIACFALMALTSVSASAAERPSLRDPQDGWMDLSAFLDTAYGFVPLVMPITEPAVGYGAAGAVVFIDRPPHVEGQPSVRPNIAALGGLATENGTEGLFAGHLGNWLDGRLRTTVALADADVNLEFFGLGDQASDSGVEYEIDAQGGIAGASYRFASFPLYAGLRYTRVDTRVTLADPLRADVPPEDLDLRLVAATPSVTLDTRDNFFTPTRGWYVDLSYPLYRDSLGSDRDFELTTLQAQYFHPLAEKLFFGIRAAAKDSSDGTPFFLRPYVSLRGVQALRYQGEQSLEAEAELRWQFHPRFSAVVFGGAGEADTEIEGRERSRSVESGGAGIRYLIARVYGLHMGLDVAFGPDDPVFYVIFGSSWLKP